MKKRLIVAASFLLFVSSGCGSGSSTPPSTDGEDKTLHLVGGSAFAATELDEATNSCTAPQVVGYTLDATGAVISGNTEASNPTPDCYRFTVTAATQWIKARIFISGTASQAVKIALKCEGFSTYSDVDGTNRVGVEPKPCTLSITPSASQAGLAYTLEFRSAD